LDFLPVAEKFRNLGFSFVGTENTAKFLRKNGFDCEMVFKISSGKHPNVGDLIEQKKVEMVINTPKNFAREEVSDGYGIRRTATDQNIPLVMNLQVGKAIAKSLFLRLPIFCKNLTHESKKNRIQTTSSKKQK